MSYFAIPADRHVAQTHAVRFSIWIVFVCIVHISNVVSPFLCHDNQLDKCCFTVLCPAFLRPALPFFSRSLSFGCCSRSCNFDDARSIYYSESKFASYCATLQQARSTRDLWSYIFGYSLFKKFALSISFIAGHTKKCWIFFCYLV